MSKVRTASNNSSYWISFCCYIPVFIFICHRPTIFSNGRSKLNQFGHNVCKDRLVNTVVASSNTIMGEMTEISQWKKTASHIHYFLHFVYYAAYLCNWALLCKQVVP